MNKENQEDRFCRVPCTEAMVPVVDVGNEPESILVLVDDRPARCFISKPKWPEQTGSEKIVLLFDEKHPRCEYCFATKYFRFEQPGSMAWGHNGEHMRILC